MSVKAFQWGFNEVSWRVRIFQGRFKAFQGISEGFTNFQVNFVGQRLSRSSKGVLRRFKQVSGGSKKLVISDSKLIGFRMISTHVV